MTRRHAFRKKTKNKKEDEAQSGKGTVSWPRHPSSHGAACGGEGSVEGKKSPRNPTYLWRLIDRLVQSEALLEWVLGNR